MSKQKAEIAIKEKELAINKAASLQKEVMQLFYFIILQSHVKLVLQKGGFGDFRLVLIHKFFLSNIKYWWIQFFFYKSLLNPSVLGVESTFSRVNFNPGF